jgi:ParB/RepB/Spo0J family partition protein
VVRRSGLGRGLGSLIPTEVGNRPSALAEIPVAAIRPNAKQPRGAFDEDSMASLTASVRAVGILQPILVRPAGESDYELIAGERRWRAAKRAGLQSVPAIVRDTTDVDAVAHALVENLHRTDLNPLEEAGAYQQLIEDFGLTHEQLSAQVGKSRATITNILRLFQLPPSVQKLITEASRRPWPAGWWPSSCRCARSKRRSGPGARAPSSSGPVWPPRPASSGRPGSWSWKNCSPPTSTPGSRSISDPAKAGW